MWQRDALRRLSQLDGLKPADYDELLLICKGTNDVAVAIDAAHVRDPAAASAAITLRSIHSVEHVNALANGERLTFGKTGLTVIYGDNGSGKSGYRHTPP